MFVQKIKNNQYIYISIIAVLITIIIGVVIWFLTRNNNKENYINEINDDMEYTETYEDYQDIENYFVNGYAIEYVENFELLNIANNHCNPLNEQFNKILHISNILCAASSNLQKTRKEAERIGLHNKLYQRILKDQESANKFSTDFHIILAKHYKNLSKVVEKIAPEIFDEVKKESQIEKFSLECYGKNKLSNMIKIQDKIILQLKNALKMCLIRSDNLDSIFNNQKVRKYCEHAKINPNILLKIIENKDEVLKFLNNETTLENYDPDSFIENYSWWSKIKKTVSKVTNKITDTALKVGKWIKKTASNIKDGIIKGYEQIKGKIGDAFDKIHDKIVDISHSALKGIKDVVKKIGQASKKAWEAIKKAFAAAGKWIVNFAKDIFKKIMEQYLRVVNNCDKGVPNPCITYQVNDKQLKIFILNKFQDILYSTFLTSVAWVFQIPVVGKTIKDSIATLILPLFDKIWEPMRDTVSSVVTSIIHAIAPETKNFKLEFTEWFSIVNYVYEKFNDDVLSGEFENNYKEHIRKTIKNHKKHKNNEKYVSGNTTRDSQCSVKWYGKGDCKADGNLNPLSCTKYSGRCYTNNPNSQCTSDNQCQINFLGECVNKVYGKSSLNCTHSGTLGMCLCTNDKTYTVDRL